MSELAKDYYQERREKYNFGRVPTILNGEPNQLIGDDQYIPVQKPETMAFDMAAMRLNLALVSTADFIMGCVPLDYSQEGLTIDRRYHAPARLENFASTAISNLAFPKAIKAGKVREIAVEAVARQEIGTGMLSRAMKNTYFFRNSEEEGVPGESTEAYMELTSTIETGSRIVKSLGLIVVRAALHRSTLAVEKDLRTILPVYGFAKARTTDLSARSALQDSAAAARIVTANNMAKARSSAFGNNQ